MKEDFAFQNIILKYLNDPENEILAKQVAESRLESPEKEQLFQDVKTIWENASLTKALNGPDYKLSLASFKENLTDHVIIRRNRNGWLKIAAAVAIITFAGYWIIPRNKEIVYIIKETHQQIDSVFLSDGTKVILAANTRVKYAEKLDATSRQISLEKGQAFFKVHRDVTRPFDVIIGQSKVTVLGTSFNINFGGKFIKLAVKTGKVMFTPNAVSTASVLVAGQALNYDLVLQRIEMGNGANANAWITKQLEFVDMPLEEVCNQLSAYYNIKIVFHDRKHSSKKFNANFKDSSLEEILAVLKQTYKIKIETNDHIITINNL